MQNAAIQNTLEADDTRKIGGAFRTISEVATDLGVQQHVLRFWETKFNQIRPMKRGGGRRYYRPEDVTLLKHIHTLLYSEGYTIKGVQKLLKGQSRSAIVATHSATEAAEKARTTAQNAAPVTKVAEAPKLDLPPAIVDVLSSMLADLKDLRSMVSQTA